MWERHLPHGGCLWLNLCGISFQLARPLSPGRTLYSAERSVSETPVTVMKSTNRSTGSSGRTSVNKSSSRGSSPVGSPKLGRPPSPRLARPSSPSLSNRRGNSPQRQQSFLELAEHVLKKRVQRALHARLYLLHKIGPNSFLVGGDLPEHKYRVRIGEQVWYLNHSLLIFLYIILSVLKVLNMHVKAAYFRRWDFFSKQNLLPPYLWNRKAKTFSLHYITVEIIETLILTHDL